MKTSISPIYFTNFRLRAKISNVFQNPEGLENLEYVWKS